MGTGSFHHGFEHGASVKDLPLVFTKSGDAKTWWVDSTRGSNNNTGTDKKPFATIAYAVSRCTANKGDVIMVAPNHQEAVIAAGTLTINIAGITIIFLGDGDTQARINFTTAVTASMVVSADNVTLIYPRFVAGIDALTGPISITGTNCRIYDATYVDGTNIDTTDGVIAANTATGLEIHGYRYILGNEGGTQKQSHIQMDGVDNAIVTGLDISGNFETGNFENVTDELLNFRMESWKIKNTNATPKPGIVLDANTTGMAKNIDVRIVSGSTYVSNVAKLNWDNQCLGYNADGYGGDPIGTGAVLGIEGKVDAIQADIGDPSARTNFKSLETMIGIPDAANSCVDDILRTGYDSSAQTRNVDGSLIERLEDLKQDISGASGIAAFPVAAAPANGVNVAAVIRSIYNNTAVTDSLTFRGTCDVGMVGSTTTVVSADLAGYGDDYFNNKFYMQVLKNTNSVGNAPETQIRLITDYVSTTGTFTTVAFGANVEESDEVVIIHELLVNIGRDVDGTTTDTLHGKIGTDTEMADRSVFDLLGGDGFDTAFPAAAAPAADVSLGEVLHAVYDDTVTIGTSVDGTTTDSINGKIGTDTEMADRSLFDLLGGDGFDTAFPAAAAPAADVSLGEVLHAVYDDTVTIGTNVDGTTTDTLQGKIGTDTEMADRSVFDLLGGDGFDTAFPAAAAPAADVSLGEVLHAVYDDTVTIGTNVDGTTTDTLNGKLGTDTELADRSMFDLLGGDGFAVYPASAAPGNDVSLAEVASAIYDDTNTISGAALPAAPTANSLAAFVASGGTALGTELADSKSLVDAIGSDGTTLSYGSGSALGAIGTVVMVQKTLVSSAVVQASVAVTGVSSGGDLALEEVWINTDPTGLANGTNFQLEYSGNTNGVTVFFAETVASLGANQTENLASGSVTSIAGTVLESGSQVLARSTVADCTGAGTITITLKFRRIAAGATVAAA